MSWKIVQNFSRSESAPDGFSRLDAFLSSADVAVTRLESSGGRAALVSARGLVESAADALKFSGALADAPEPAAKVLAVAPGTGPEDAESLFAELAGGPLSLRFPALLALSDDDASSAGPALKAFRPAGPREAGTLSLRLPKGAAARFSIHRLTAPPARPLGPTGLTLGEGPGNLSGRAGWFRGRTGK